MADEKLPETHDFDALAERIERFARDADGSKCTADIGDIESYQDILADHKEESPGVQSHIRERWARCDAIANILRREFDPDFNE